VWDVPIYAHRLEIPYLTGKSDYPPPDPTVGGAIAFLSRFMPSHTRDFGERVRELHPNKVPAVAGWEWLATPGHSPGMYLSSALRIASFSPVTRLPR
jgi:glyoxylase-like metal-dependent hydrolase (beta-lactamase superfamily II)